jgi:hypothetical protein
MGIKFGGSGIDREVCDWIHDNIKHGSTILELGSGDVSTPFLSQYFTLFSIEEDKKYVGKYNSSYIYAPISRYGWYDLDELFNSILFKDHVINKFYDAILIDGPSREETRLGFLIHSYLFNFNIPLIFHDTNRPTEQALVKLVSEKVKRPIQYFENKDFFVVI